MTREIEILRAAARKGCAVVEKDTNVLWSEADLFEAELAERFDTEDRLLAPDLQAAVTAIFPGCLQQSSRMPDVDALRPVGQTTHFVIFAPGVS